jgi:hypothetical protein
MGQLIERTRPAARGRLRQLETWASRLRNRILDQEALPLVELRLGRLRGRVHAVEEYQLYLDERS